MLRGASAEALAELSQQATRTQTLDDAATLGTKLFGVASVVRRDAALRRALTDASVEGEAQVGAGPGGVRHGTRRPGDEPGRRRREPALDRRQGPARRPRAGRGGRHRPLCRRQGQAGRRRAVRGPPDDRRQPDAAWCAGRPLAHRRGPQRAAPGSPRRQDPPGHSRARGTGGDPGARAPSSVPLRGVPRPGRGRPRGGGRHGDTPPASCRRTSSSGWPPRSASSTARTSSCTWSSTRR